MKTLPYTLLFFMTLTGARASGLEADGELVYRDNCTRCHTTIHAFSPRMAATVVRHMQVKANLTSKERASVLQYLLQTVASKKSGEPGKEKKP